MREPVKHFSFHFFIMTLRLTPAWGELVRAKKKLFELNLAQMMDITVVGARLEKVILS